MFSYSHFKSLNKEIKATFTLAVPMIIGQVGQMLMGLVDSIMVGQLGAAPLAAVAVGNGLFMVVIIVGIGLTMAVAPITSEYASSNQIKECGVVLRQSFLMNIIFGILLTIVAFYGADLIKLLGQSPDVEKLAISYSRILAFSTLPVVIFFVYKGFTEGLEKPKASMIINLLANLVNFIVNYLLIFGHFGFPRLEIDGAGWATFFSRFFMMVVIMIYVHQKMSYKKYEANFHFRKIDIALMKRLFNLGMAAATQYFFEVSAFICAAFMIGWMGTQPLAAHQIAINLASLTYMFALGVSMAAAVRVGGSWGNNDHQSARRSGFAAFYLIIMIMAVNAAIFIVGHQLLPTFYIDENEVIQMASKLILIAAIFQLGDGIQATMLGALRGTSDIKFPMIVTFIAYWIVALPMAYIFGFVFELGASGVWYALTLALYVSGILLTIRFYIKTK